MLYILQWPEDFSEISQPGGVEKIVTLFSCRHTVKRPTETPPSPGFY